GHRLTIVIAPIGKDSNRSNIRVNLLLQNIIARSTSHNDSILNLPREIIGILNGGRISASYLG
ncbi:hypothetical protein ACJX0J_019603, partial [Zea mays]